MVRQSHPAGILLGPPSHLPVKQRAVGGPGTHRVANGDGTRLIAGTRTDTGITTLGRNGIRLGRTFRIIREAIMHEIGSKLRLTYYDASDGPRVMIFGPLDADFGSLQRLFTRLSGSPSEPCELDQQPFIAAFGGTKITLASSGPMFAQKGHATGIRRVKAAIGPAFEWRRTNEGWDYLAKLIEPIVTKGHAGHQYLTSYPSEDVIVVVSKGEYGDDVLQQIDKLTILCRLHSWLHSTIAAKGAVSNLKCKWPERFSRRKPRRESEIRGPAGAVVE